MVLHQYLTSLASLIMLIYHFLLAVRSLVQLSFYLNNLRLSFVLRLSDVAHAAQILLGAGHSAELAANVHDGDAIVALHLRGALLGCNLRGQLAVVAEVKFWLVEHLRSIQIEHLRIGNRLVNERNVLPI